MIIEMARVRVLGPRPLLGATVRALQDRGCVHVVDATCLGALQRREQDAPVRRRRRHLERAVSDIERALAGLAQLGAEVSDRDGAPPAEGRAARLGARIAAETAELRARAQVLGDERAELLVYAPLFDELDTLLANGVSKRASIFLLRLRDQGAAVDELRTALVATLGEALELRTHALATGETVALLLVPAARALEVERYLAEARVERAALPASMASAPLADALPRLRPRLAEIERELARITERAKAMARDRGDELARARRAFHDALIAQGAEDHAAASARAFVIEGWLPAREVRDVGRALAGALGSAVSLEQVARDEWRGDDAPVVLANPPMFKPFEVLTSLLPLPRYGTVDPTPFVAVFFPMLFGVIVGDIGYGAVIGALALVLWRTGRRDLARIGGAVAFYTIVFGILYGELFGDAGARWFGMRPLWFDRSEGILGFLALAVALGLVHLVLGLVIAAASRWRRHKREAIGRGITAMMLVLVAVALLALLERVPAVLLRPAAIALLVALPVVVILEGMTALLDFMTILGHVLSYARVMALGIASVMLAVVANRMHGAFGSAALGIAFALVFHLVNFAITLFSPTIQVMRLHYVEFFGTFFEPGGGPYRPLRHWSPGAAS